jgi:hypothetical protein
MARYTTNAEIILLSKYAKLSKKGIVEIGVLDGETTKKISEFASCPIYGIDPIIPDSMDHNLIGSKTLILENMKHYENFTFLNDYSFNVVENFNYNFDFIFIDGDHKYESVKKDFYDWFKKLEPNGFIAFHDSGKVTSVNSDFQGWEGCVRLIKEIINNEHFENEIIWIENVDTINVFQKK